MMNVNIGDNVYIWRLMPPKARMTAKVLQKGILDTQDGPKDIISCNVTDGEKEERVVFTEEEWASDAYGECLYGKSDGTIGYLLFASEEARDRNIERENAFIRIRHFMSGGDCIIRRDKDGPEKIKRFDLKDYSLEDLSKIEEILGIVGLPHGF